MESPKELVLQLIEQITLAFADVSREGGVSLHQTRVLDDQGSHLEMVEAWIRDVDTHWREVPDSSIEKPDLSLNFLDPIGLRYYLPAYMSWELKQDEGLVPWVDCNTHGSALFSLTLHKETELRQWQEERFDLLTTEQARATNRFLHFYAWYGEDFNQRYAQQALDAYWSQCD